MFAAPEGAACVAALRKLLASGFLKPDERIVIYNTGSGLKYLEAYSTRFPRAAAAEQDKLGGLITPAMKKHRARRARTPCPAAASPTPTCACIETRDRHVSTKNGKAGPRLQLRIDRASAFACWPPAAGASPPPTTSAARASKPPPRWPSKSPAPAATPRSRTSQLAPEATLRGRLGLALRASTRSPFRWTATSPCCWPSTRELRRNPGVILAEASMRFERAPPGLRLHPRQRHRPDAHHHRRRLLRAQLQGRRDPAALLSRTPSAASTSSRATSWSTSCACVENAPRIAEEAVALHSADQCPEGVVRPHPRQLPARPADPRIHRPPHRARPRARQRGQLRRHELPHARQAAAACATARTSSTWCATRARSTAPASAPSPSTTKACPRNRTDIIRNGLFTGYMTSRETAAADRRAALERHHARRRLGRIPLIRMTNVSLQPGRADRSTRSSAATASTWRPTGAGPSTTSATTSSSAARSAGRSRRQARPHAQEPQLQRHQHGVLEFLRGHRRARSTGRSGACPTAARASPSR